MSKLRTISVLMRTSSSKMFGCRLCPGVNNSDIHIYIYIYIERDIERDIGVYIHIYIYI